MDSDRRWMLTAETVALTGGTLTLVAAHPTGGPLVGLLAGLSTCAAGMIATLAGSQRRANRQPA
jgi:hypothetical protein